MRNHPRKTPFTFLVVGTHTTGTAFQEVISLARFKEHGVLMYLSNELYQGFVMLQATKGLGRSYAALLPFVEGLYSMGYISEDVYQHYSKKYSQPLRTETFEKEAKKLSKVKKINDTLGGVLEQWDLHPEESWRQKWLKIAKRHSELDNARLLLQKAEEVSR